MTIVLKDNTYASNYITKQSRNVSIISRLTLISENVKFIFKAPNLVMLNISHLMTCEEICILR